MPGSTNNGQRNPTPTLKQLRRRDRRTLSQVAIVINCTCACVQAWESGAEELPDWAVRPLAKVLLHDESQAAVEAIIAAARETRRQRAMPAPSMVQHQSPIGNYFTLCRTE